MSEVVEKSIKFKIVLSGNPFSGKSTLRKTYLGEQYTSSYIITLGSDFSFLSMRHKSGRMLNISIWDLAGQKEYTATHPLYYRGALGALVVYSVVDRTSFKDIPNWVEEFYKGTNQNDYPILIIGNKIDLIENGVDHITEEEETDLVNRLRTKYPNVLISSIRTSAKSGENVNEAFEKFTDDVLDWLLSKKKKENKLYKIDKNLETNFPSAIIMSMNNLSGPVTIASSPAYSTFTKDERRIIQSQVMRLIGSLDFEDMVFHTSVKGSYPWIVPSGSMSYIAFVMENSRARGKKELFIIGLNINREIFSIIDGVKNILDGYLHGSMNEFARLSSNEGFDFVVDQFNPEEQGEIIKELEGMLFRLRLKAEEAIENWIENTSVVE